MSAIVARAFVLLFIVDFELKGVRSGGDVTWTIPYCECLRAVNDIQFSAVVTQPDTIDLYARFYANYVRGAQFSVSEGSNFTPAFTILTTTPTGATVINPTTVYLKDQNTTITGTTDGLTTAQVKDRLAALQGQTMR